MDNETLSQPVQVSEPEQEPSILGSDVGIDMDLEHEQESEVLPSIEDEHQKENKQEDAGDNSMLSEMTDESHDQDHNEDSFAEHAGLDDADTQSHTSHPTQVPDEGGDSSSHHEATDEEVFSDKSPRSSMGSYDGGSESGKVLEEADNMTTVTRSPRISDISQYDKEDFVPTARGTPRPPFRTPSDVRAMQMSSPAPSVVGGSPRPTKRHFPTVSRLGTPSASAQYSPKRQSTPPRFKSRQEAPLVLLHVTLLPLRWVWGDMVNTLDSAHMSEQAKTLQESWRILQDRVGDTVVERGILLGHPQNDYEVLEERLLEALELPFRRRARILECGHYIGPANETTLTEDEDSEDDYGHERAPISNKRHWCKTCKHEIRCEDLGAGKIFRVKIFASNGLMKAGAWAACWKEMERVDVELEPIVEPAVQDELVRLAATQQERELAQQEAQQAARQEAEQEEAEIAREVAKQFEQQRQQEEAELRRAQAEVPAPSEPEPVRKRSRVSKSERRRMRDEDRRREIYGETSPAPETPAREPSVHPAPDPDPYVPPPFPQPAREEPPLDQKETPPRPTHQSDSLPELLLQSLKVLVQDRRNVVIITLSVFVLMLALRSAPREQLYETAIHGMKNVPGLQHVPVVENPVEPSQVVSPPQHEAPVIESQASSVVPQQVQSSVEPSQVVPPAQSEAPIVEPETSSVVPEQVQPPVEPEMAAPSHEKAEAVVSQPTPVQESSSVAASVSTVYGPCETPVAPENKEANTFVSEPPPASIVETEAPPSSDTESEASPAQAIVSEAPSAPAPAEETEIVTERKIVRIVHTVTMTETEIETATETCKVKATEIVEPPAPVEDESLEEACDSMAMESDDSVDEQDPSPLELDDDQAELELPVLEHDDDAPAEHQAKELPALEDPALFAEAEPEVEVPLANEPEGREVEVNVC